MSKTCVSRTSACCWRSVFAEIHPQRQLRRSLATLQRGPVEKLEVPTDLPSQYWAQLPARLKPDRGKREIVIHKSPRSEAETCKEPISVVDKSQLALLDPTGARAKLFDKTNKDRAKVGDILLATFTSGEPVSGVILSIKGSGPHTSVLLRNDLTGVGMEMQVKVHSPLVQSMEIAQRAPKRKRRARIYYLRKPEHDIGSVQKVVDQYLRQRAMLTGGKPGSQFGRSRPKKGKR
ncbi:mitochondrial 54S ribosomal protein IMG1 [Cladophialophora carrionii]|uniref:Mitochondrial 54S ribosomal protein IMG1 n=1 Tax=Cladophialophora carrionii TaxID=86049 RepID=A0A1C1CBJ5_9EURO|nr:mitochondrial 54S ribosomal protein IMG1 [Cladophialophora carrionii]